MIFCLSKNPADSHA
uniref:Uncharacterized protein n=1 Tax=Arundo donax TaxID=35708 RepID=A0A0A8YAB2_ARUDO